MDMSFRNWIGIGMLVLALLLNEGFLVMTTWYDFNVMAVLGAIIYLVVAVALSVWPSPESQTT